MRIPRRVDTALSWVERYRVALTAVIVLVVVAALLRWQPVLAALVLGGAFGGFLVHTRSSRHVRRARREIDELLRQNGALRHRNTMLGSGVIQRGSQMTEVLVAIPDVPGAPDEPGITRPLEPPIDEPDDT
ncbi:hypothetical protein [Actinomadura sp. SCN-SB]|uniref:hypothetical protein n=1 Tax=Actinomadura sp. SCN-SB TaxID=3373092 RepID=UPI0037533D57